jgi:hypothetical protein
VGGNLFLLSFASLKGKAYECWVVLRSACQMFFSRTTVTIQNLQTRETTTLKEASCSAVATFLIEGSLMFRCCHVPDLVRSKQ